MNRFMSNIRDAFATEIEDARDRGDLVQTIIITAGFAVAGFLLVNWISTALLNKGADIAGCVEGSSSYGTSGTASADNCQKQNHAAGEKSFTNDSGYKSRFGGK